MDHGDHRRASPNHGRARADPGWLAVYGVPGNTGSAVVPHGGRSRGVPATPAGRWYHHQR